MTLAEQADAHVQWARAYHRDNAPVGLDLLEQLGRAAARLERLLSYAAHRRGCVSTLPCSCGLEALLREAAP